MLTFVPLARDVSNKVATASRFKCLRYLTLRYRRYLRTTTSRT